MGQDYIFMVPLYGKIQKKYEKNSGQDMTTQYHLGKVLNGLEMKYPTEISRPVLNFGNLSQIFPKFQIREYLFHFWDWDGTEISQSQMAGLRQDQEEDVSECSGWEISQIFPEKIWFPGNGIRERRPLKEICDDIFINQSICIITN